MRTLHYITGDTQQTGFRRIGGSPSFPADQLLWLNNGEPIPEQARVSSGSYSQGGSGIRQLSHVWEYQTGAYGKPVLINSIVAIGSARQHGFSEYVLGTTDNVASEAEPWQLIRSSEENTRWLDTQTFMSIPGREEIPCEEEEWIPGDITEKPRFEHPVDDTWKLVVLSHYWKQASIRAFSEDSPTTIRVNLGAFSEDDAVEDNEKTIEQAKLFFSDVIVKGLPRQVQNIASFSAGVNAADTVTLYSAMEVDVSLNMYADETLRIDRPRDIRAFRLTDAELQFIGEVSQGQVPAVVREFFERYKKLAEHENDDTTELNTPFMADYRVWYGLYCMGKIAEQGHAFISEAGLNNEHGSQQPVGDTRACFTLMNQMHKLLESDHRLTDIRRSLVAELLEPLETGLLKFMLDDMNRDGAKPFMLKRNDMVEFHRRTLYYAPDSQMDLLTDLAVRDQQVAAAPQFVRCYPSVPLRNDTADERNAKVLSALLSGVMGPIIDREKDGEKIENKYLNELRSEDFAQKWALINQNEKTRRAVANFLREQIEDPQKHFYLYGISKVYLPLDELLYVTLKHFTKNNTDRNHLPSERQRKIAEDGCREYVSKAGSEDQDCVADLNKYYQACFREFRGNIGAISDMVQQFGGNTSGAMRMIFDEAAEEREERLTPEEAKAVFDTFGGKDGRYAKDEQVVKAYQGMINARCDAALKASGDELESNREALVPWIASMAETAPFEVDTSDCIRAIFESTRSSSRISMNAAAEIFQRLMPGAVSVNEKVRPAFTGMLKDQLDASLEMHDEDILEWLSGMVDVSDGHITLDTTDMLKKIFEAGKTGERMKVSDASDALRALGGKAENKGAVQRSYTEMLAVRREEAKANRDEEAFEWLCRMGDNSPWRKNEEWLNEQHAANIALLCDISQETGEAANSAFLSTIQTWLDQGTVPAKGIARLQRYCNARMLAGDGEAAEKFMPYFERLESDCDELRKMQFGNTVQRLKDELKKPGGSFGDLVTECQADVEKAGKRLEDLYDETKPEVKEYIRNHFETTTDLRALIEELDRIPPNTNFYQEWQGMLGDQIFSQQVELFNRQPNLERLKELKEDVLKRSQRSNPALNAAYELMDSYGERLQKMADASEYEVVTNMDKQLSEINTSLDRASDVRKTLCTALRNESWPEMKQVEGKSFRHLLCAQILQATLTDEAKTVTTELGSSKGCPEWSKVLGCLFPRSELDEATKKPFAKKNLPTLQKFLSTLETVRTMSGYGMDPSWGDDLLKTIHGSSELHRYQSALARNKKMCERYNLAFDTDGIRFKMKTE